MPRRPALCASRLPGRTRRTSACRPERRVPLIQPWPTMFQRRTCPASRLRARVRPRGRRRREDLGTGRGKDVLRRADVLRTARRDARGLEEREPDAARAPAGDDLREEGIDVDDARVELGAYAIPISAV